MKERILKKDPKLVYIGRNLPGKDELVGENYDLALVLFFSRSGAKFYVDSRCFIPRSGDVAAINYDLDVSVDIGDLPESSLTCMVVENARLYGDSSLFGGGVRLCASGDYRGITEAALRQLMRETSVKLPAGESLIETLLSTVMTLLVRIMPVTLRPHKSSKVFYAAKEYLDNNYLSDETFVEVCKKLNIDRFYLTHVFKQEIGIPPVKYVIGKRMRQARELLETTELDINMIARSCGYVDPAYFCRVFKNTQGQTALAYRADFKQRMKELRLEEEKTGGEKEERDISVAIEPDKNY